jgi:hypothetical protein
MRTRICRWHDFTLISAIRLSAIQSIVWSVERLGKGVNTSSKFMVSRWNRKNNSQDGLMLSDITNYLKVDFGLDACMNSSAKSWSG